MKKKIFILVIVFAVLAIAGSIFYYWQSQKQVWALNKTLPKEVRVGKSIFGNKYKVVNKIDGYEFKIPEQWAGIKEIEYIPKEEASGYVASTIYLEGNVGGSRIVTVNKFNAKEGSIDLKRWAENFFDEFGLVGDFTEEWVGNIKIVKTTEEKHLLGMYVIFFEKDEKFYRLINGSEEYIKQIINSGKW